MKYQFESAEAKATLNNDGTVEFTHNGIRYRTTREAAFDNSPSNNYSTYSAPLVAWNNEEETWDDVGKVEWDIIGGYEAWKELEDEAHACNWDEFNIYF